jgi:hypothetical protein
MILRTQPRQRGPGFPGILQRAAQNICNADAPTRLDVMRASAAWRSGKATRAFKTLERELFGIGGRKDLSSD